MKKRVPGIGDHLKHRRTKGHRYMVTGRDGKHLLVRNIDLGVPARIPRAELDEWKVVWECRPGLSNLMPWTDDLLTRTDGDGARV